MAHRVLQPRGRRSSRCWHRFRIASPVTGSARSVLPARARPRCGPGAVPGRPRDGSGAEASPGDEAAMARCGVGGSRQFEGVCAASRRRVTDGPSVRRGHDLRSEQGPKEPADTGNHNVGSGVEANPASRAGASSPRRPGRGPRVVWPATSPPCQARALLGQCSMASDAQACLVALRI
jgi:hypothetical protein